MPRPKQFQHLAVPEPSREDDMEGELMTVKEALKLLPMRRQTLYRLINEGVLQATRPSPKKLWISRRSWVRWLASQNPKGSL
jgi:excisionase family DNA binding protein